MQEGNFVIERSAYALIRLIICEPPSHAILRADCGAFRECLFYGRETGVAFAVFCELIFFTFSLEIFIAVGHLK
jgi:hypothetical protein